MYLKKYIADRRFVGENELVRFDYRRARLLDFIPAILLFARIVWRKWEEERLSVSMAWSIATGVHNLEKMEHGKKDKSKAAKGREMTEQDQKKAIELLTKAGNELQYCEHGPFCSHWGNDPCDCSWPNLIGEIQDFLTEVAKKG